MKREIQGTISQTKAIVNVTNVWFFTFECQNIILYYKFIMCLHDNVSNILWENVKQFCMKNNQK
jgi:hypothetical protein